MIKVRGRRILGTPETSGKPIKPNWIKMFADASTIWSGRGLYCGIDFDFEIPCIFSLSTNDDFELAKIDGGTRRRAIGVQWDVHFTSNPQAEHERLAHPKGHGIKRPEFFTTDRKSGFLFFLFAVMKVFFRNDRMALTEKYMPTAIQDATWKILTSIFSEQLEAWKDDNCEACSLSMATRKDAMVKEVRDFLMKIAGREINEKEIQKSIQASFTFPTSGRVARTRNAHGTKNYLKFKD